MKQGMLMLLGVMLSRAVAATTHAEHLSLSTGVHKRSLVGEIELKTGTFPFVDIDVFYQMFDHPDQGKSLRR